VSVESVGGSGGRSGGFMGRIPIVFLRGGAVLGRIGAGSGGVAVLLERSGRTVLPAPEHLFARYEAPRIPPNPNNCSHKSPNGHKYLLTGHKGIIGRHS